MNINKFSIYYHHHLHRITTLHHKRLLQLYAIDNEINYKYVPVTSTRPTTLVTATTTWCVIATAAIEVAIEVKATTTTIEVATASKIEAFTTTTAASTTKTTSVVIVTAAVVAEANSIIMSLSFRGKIMWK